MERSAVYRRALAPIMTLLGLVGTLAAFGGRYFKIETPSTFAAYWMCVSVVAAISAFLLVRRQALKAGEPFWSLPSRRVSQAAMPALFSGLLAGVMLGVLSDTATTRAWWLPSLWMALYGCAVHAAGFFMPRGMKLFGWIFILAAAIEVFRLRQFSGTPSLATAHCVMGTAFGGLHLAYGIYLYFTEKKTEAA